MKIFLSWSGERSRRVAISVNAWIKRNIQLADPWISTEGIESGAVWFDDIKRELDETSIGIIFLTRENVGKPWILFEAGALAKGTKNNRVCTFLIDIEQGEISQPLAQFNSTVIEKESFKKLVKTISAGLLKPLTDEIIDDIMGQSWSALEAQLRKILSETVEAPAPKKATAEEIREEILANTRANTNTLNVLAHAVEKLGAGLEKNQRDDSQSFLSQYYKHLPSDQMDRLRLALDVVDSQFKKPSTRNSIIHNLSDYKYDPLTDSVQPSKPDSKKE